MNTTAEYRNNWWLQIKRPLARRVGLLWLCLSAAGGPAPLTVLTALALAFGVPGRAQTQAAAIPFPDIGARVTSDYHGDALSVTATPDGARLRCGFQKLEGHATAEGFWLESTAWGAAGKLRLVVSAVHRGDGSSVNSQTSITLPAIGTVSVQDKSVRFTRPVVTEEYSVSVYGVRQDFVIGERSAGVGALRVELTLSGARAEAAADGATLRLDGSERMVAYNGLRVEDATGRKLAARLEVVSADRLAVSVTDIGAFYPVRIDPTFTDANWVSLGSGMDGVVYALAVSGTNLYAGGRFTMAGGLPATNIAKWDGSAWSALGSGMDGVVYALAVSGTDLYTGGRFTMAGGLPATNIARWDGSTWSALGSGTDGAVLALAVSGTDLYAGGNFIRADGVSANRIAKWSGGAWSALGAGMTGPVNALGVSGANLYAGGDMNTPGCLAKWDGHTWSSLGLYQTVYALAVSGTNIYAGGRIYEVVKYDGYGYWDGVGPAFNNHVLALALVGTNLYAGGYFTNVGGATANNIAQWDGTTWSALGSGMGGSYPYYGCVTALAADGVGHLFVGGYFTWAGTNVCAHIVQANVGRAPTILAQPASQTAEAGATVLFTVDADAAPSPKYQWLFNGTNALTGMSTIADLVLTNALFSRSGAYTVVVTNDYGARASAPAMLNVIGPVDRRWVWSVKLMGQIGDFLGVDYSDQLGPTAHWQTMATITLSNAWQWCFDVSDPLPAQRFYRAWRAGAPGKGPSLAQFGMVPAITLTGNIGDALRLDYINQFGPIDAWETLAAVTLTNTSQLYFDVSTIGQPARLYRIVPLP